MSTGFACFNATRNLNCASVQQQFFSQGRFTRIWVRDDGKAATSKYFCGWCAGGGGIDGKSALVNLSTDAIISVRAF